jgi:hypothetical protein
MEDALCFTPTPLTLLVSPAHRTAPAPTRTASHHPLTPISVPITSDGIDLAVEQIRFATDPQIASDYLFCFLRSCFGVGAMFAVSGVLAQGRFGFSAGLVRPAVESITFSLSLPSCFRIARSRRTLWRGAPPPDGQAVHRTLWMALRCAPPSEVLVCPVIVDSQVTLLVYAQGNQGESLDSQSANRMEQVCSALGDSLLRLAV